MHQIEPYYRWLNHYDSSNDDRSPFHGKEYNYDLYSENIYGYYIDPAWDYFGSETLYLKLLFLDYDQGYAVIELIGEWNDAINNDIMLMKRNILEHLMEEGISKFIMIGENILNFHGSDDSYYEEWFEEVEDGWIACVNFRDFVISEMSVFQIDNYLIFGGALDTLEWRTLPPLVFCARIEILIQKRLSIG